MQYYTRSNAVLPLVFVFVCLILSGCGRETSLGEGYPEPFYGQLLMGDSLVAPQPQAASERVFEDSAYVVVKQFSVHPNAATPETPTERILSAPVRAVVDAAERHLYVLDQESMSVIKYAIADASIVDVFKLDINVKHGGGVNMVLKSEEELWISGAEKDSIVRITTDGRRLEDMDAEHAGMPMVADNGDFVLAGIHDPEALFHTYSVGMEKQHAFAVLTNHKVSIKDTPYPGHGMGFIGEGVSDGSPSFVYAGLMGGGLLSYNMDGSLRYYRQSIVHNDFPGLLPDTTQVLPSMVFNMDGVKGQQIPMNTWDGEYYQFYSEFDASGGATWRWDAYQYDTGDYLYSIRPVTNCGYNFITSEHIYAHCLNEGFFQLKTG